MSNVLSWTKGTHNIRTGFDLRKMATGRRAANSPRGAFSFNGQMTGYSVADFMTGVPITVGTPVDQVQGHVGQWRNGFFINDVWQATRNMTLSLGLRYERNTPVQTYEGLASMLNADQTQIIPTSFPAVGFEFHEPNNKDFGPRLGATYRLTEKTVLRAGWGIYYNPNQMNSFTFLTNNPPIAAEFTFSNNPSNPTLSFDQPFGTVGTGRSAEHDHAEPATCRTRARTSGAPTSSTSCSAPRWSNCSTSRRARRTSTAATTTTRHCPGPARSTRVARTRRSGEIRTIQNDLIANYDSVSVIARRRMTKGFMLNAHYTWSKTRDMATHSNGGGRIVNNFDIWSDYGPANWDVPHRLVVSYIWDMPFFRDSDEHASCAASSAAGRSAASRRSRAARRSTSPSSRIGPTSGVGNQRPISSTPSVELNCQDNPNGLGLVGCIDPARSRCPTYSHSATRRATTCAGRSTARPTCRS